MIALVCRDYRDKPRLFDFARRAASVLYSTAYAEFVKIPPRPQAQQWKSARASAYSVLLNLMNITDCARPAEIA